MKNIESGKIFKFGGGECLQSAGEFKIPAKLAGKDIYISTDVVESDIPLLLSKDAMKKAGMKLNLEKDTAEIYGKEIALNETSSGHYCVPIDEGKVDVATVYAVDFKTLNDKERHSTIFKLHRQFAHPSKKRLQCLLQDAGKWEPAYKEVLDIIYDNCEICKKYKVTPARPAVALPMASRFNGKVCMDLKKWDSRWILHLIDMFSRFSVSVFVERKTAKDILNKIMQNWIGAAFGVMEGILSDNGGEFTSEEIREVCSILNVTIATTGTESPFQNGLCERNHAIVDNMLRKMTEQHHDTPLEILLSWVNMAKNSLQMTHGYSSYQLVFGKNPNLPNVMNAQLPALEGTTTSEILATHLNSLHAARTAFIQSEAEERIRRALRTKVRTAEEHYTPGELVYYKREGYEKWLGPAKVVFQDGKVIFVRHGSAVIRVSANRLSKAGVNVNLQGCTK